MDRETAAVIHNADDLARWASSAVVETDRLIAAAELRPLSPYEQSRGLHILRELLVRTTQQNTLLGWAMAEQRVSWWRRMWRWAFPGPARRR
jgi:hypothetical protein